MPQVTTASTRIRHDPTEYARQQQEKVERARDLKEKRQLGIVSEDHTFAPKLKPRISSNKEDSLSKADMLNPRRENNQVSGERASRLGHHNNTINSNNNNNLNEDSLESLSRTYTTVRKQPRNDKNETGDILTRPPEQHDDTLYREVKHRTGREISNDLNRQPQKTVNAETTSSRNGPCLRNSSCTCNRCAVSNTNYPPTAVQSSIPRRQPLSNGASQTSRPGYPQSEMENSLSLLKSKMSRRKSRSAPTNQLPLVLEKTSPGPTPRSSMAAVPENLEVKGVIPQQKNGNATRRGMQAPKHNNVQKQDQGGAMRASYEENGSDQGTHPISTGFKPPVEEYPDEEEALEKCAICHRSFNLSALERHSRICAKATAKSGRKVFNMTDKRLEGLANEAAVKKAKSDAASNSKKTKDIEQIKAKREADWKQKSNMLRQAMAASRGVAQAIKNGTELPPAIPSAPDPSLIQCDYCSRRFNEKAAERHIPYCKEKSQRESMNRKPPPRKTPAVERNKGSSSTIVGNNGNKISSVRSKR